MSAGDISETVSHHDNGKTKGQSREDITAAMFGITAYKHCGSATNCYQCKCAEKLGYVLAYTVHNYLPF